MDQFNNLNPNLYNNQDRFSNLNHNLSNSHNSKQVIKKMMLSQYNLMIPHKNSQSNHKQVHKFLNNLKINQFNNQMINRKISLSKNNQLKSLNKTR